MGKIIFDNFFINRGLNEEVFKKALKIEDHELEGHIIKIQLMEKKRKKKVLFRMQVSLDDKVINYPIGLEGYSKNFVEQSIQNIKEVALHPERKLKGHWHRTDNFMEWLVLKTVKSKKKGENNDTISLNLFLKKIEKIKKQIYLIFENLAQLINLEDCNAKTFEKLLFFFEKVELAEHQDEIVKVKRKIQYFILFLSTDFEKLAASVERIEESFLLKDSSGKILVKTNRFKKFNYKNHNFSKRNVLDFHQKCCNLVFKIDHELQKIDFYKYLANIPVNLKNELKLVKLKANDNLDKISSLHNKEKYFLLNYGKFKKDYFIEGIESQEDLNNRIKSTLEKTRKFLEKPSPSNFTTPYILDLIKNSPDYGIQTYAKWLGKSKSKTLHTKKLDKKLYGKLEDQTIIKIAAEIKKLINYGWIEVYEVGRHDLPVLRINKAGKKILDFLKNKRKETLSPVIVNNKIYESLLRNIKLANKKFLIDFLSNSKNIKEIENWNDDMLKNIVMLLNSKISGWEALFQWELSKHPQKHKALKLLLDKKC